MTDPTQDVTAPRRAEPITLFLCGDIMTGRGIDQVLPHPCKPHIYEPYLRSARDYIELAERRGGRLPRKVDFAYVWHAALPALRLAHPDARIVNLETAVTTSEDAWPGKGIHYRMHPANTPCLTALHLDCCVLSNNHVLDWGRKGLTETLATLHRAGLQTAGAGGDEKEASTPAQLELPGTGRVLVTAWGMESAGVPASWAATHDRSGVSLLKDLSPRSADEVARVVDRHRRDGDLVVLSIHWGDNWGYEIPPEQRSFARRVIDLAGIDVIHGHSSHHVKGIEVYRDRPILYGCGDFLNDYEGIGGHERYRPDLSLMYFPALDATTGRLRSLTMAPTRTHRFRINRVEHEAAHWLRDVLNREGKELGTHVELAEDGRLRLSWS